MSRVFIAAIAALCIPAAGYAQTSQQCATVTEEQVAGLFDRWNASLQTGNPDEVVNNYAPGAVLLPTCCLQLQGRTSRAPVAAPKIL